MLCIFNTFTSKYFHFAHVILTMLSSTYQFWGVHNLYQAKSAKLNIGEQSKVGLFFFFLFSLFGFLFIFFRYSFFAFRYSISLFVFHFWSFTFRIRFSFFSFRFSFFWHSKSGPVSYFDVQTEVEILFWHSKPGRIHILTFKIPFRHSNWGRISNFDIKNPILTFEIRLNIEFWHSKSYFDIWTGAEYRSWHSKSYFDIRIEVEYRISTFKILFWHWKRGRISHFDIPFKILFSHSNWGWISYLNIQNPFLTFELGPNIVILHSKSYFHIRNRVEYRILTF